MASHEELLTEMPKLEKLSNAARLKHAKKRRQKQLKKWQEWLRMERATNGTSQRRTCQPQIGFQQESVLNDLVARNDIIGGKLPCQRVFGSGLGVAPPHSAWERECARCCIWSPELHIWK